MKITLGSFIAALRKEKGMTQRQLAEILGVSDKTVSHWEREESSPDISLLPIIASLFEITVDELLAGEKKQADTATDTPPEEVVTQAVKSFIHNDGTMKLLVEQRLNELRTQSLICGAVSILALVCGFIVDSILYRGNTFVCLFVVVISLTMNLIFRNKFDLALRKSDLDEDNLTPYRHKANRMSALNCYLAAGAVFLTAMLEYQERFILFFGGAVFIAGVVLAEVMLRHAGILKSKITAQKLKAVGVALVSLVLIIVVALFGNVWLLDSYNTGYFIRKNAEKISFDSIESFIEYIETENALTWDSSEFFSRTTPGKIGVITLGEIGGYGTVDGVPEYEGTIIIGGNWFEFQWRNGEVYEIIESDTLPIEVITYDAYKKSYEENSHLEKVRDFVKYALPVTEIILITFVQIAVTKKILKGNTDKKRTKKQGK